MNNQIKCENCKHFDPHNSAFGLCRKSPPSMFWYPNQSNTVDFWPEVKVQDWCGQFSQKPEE